MAKRGSQMVARGSAKWRTTFYRVEEGIFAGYVVDEADLTRRFVVELILDGIPIKLARAEIYVHDLAAEAVGDGCYGFSFSLPASTLADGFVAEARLANVGTAVGRPIVLASPSETRSEPRGFGAVRWLGGLRFEGWCMAEQEKVPIITALIDGESVAKAYAARWTHLGTHENAKAVRGFDLHLPERFANGRVRRVRFIGDNGQEIPSSPVTFVAFADGLEQTLAKLGHLESERLRGQLFDRLLPMSVPFTEYPRWCERFPLQVEQVGTSPVAIVLVGPGDEKPSLASIKEQGYPDWIAAALPEADEQAAFDPSLLRSFLAERAAQCDLVVFALSGTRFGSTSLLRLCGALASFPDAVAVYGDVEVASNDERCFPIAFSAYDYERVLEQGYGAHLFMARRAAAERALDAGASDLYRLFNGMLDREENRAGAIIHLPGPLGTLPPIDPASCSRSLASATSAHLKARGIVAKVAAAAGALFPNARVSRVFHRISTSVVIPVRNRPALLRDCLESIRPAVVSAKAEIIIVDNDSSDPDMLDYLEELDGRHALVLRVPGPFNFSQLNNIAAEKAHTDTLCLLNNDIKALDDSWLREMLGRIVDPEVGAVGALLLWPSGVVQHGGVVLVPGIGAAHAFNDRFHTDPGYADLLRVAHECSAVTAACLLTRRSDYLAVGGMDELRFPVTFNDVDYCLKLRAAGKRIVFTPHARLLHLESASRGPDQAPDRAARFEHELRVLRARWGEQLLNDSYYNPLLSLDPVPFSALAWPPRAMAARAHERPVPTDLPSGI
jgi:GT2 family glycosyltransferase